MYSYTKNYFLFDHRPFTYFDVMLPHSINIIYSITLQFFNLKLGTIIPIQQESNESFPFLPFQEI